MGVSLERVQFKFASIIGELCSEPDVLSQFAVWVDLRLAEYKLKGSISLDCSGESPDPIWLKGIKSAIIEKALSMRTPQPSMRQKVMQRTSTPLGNRDKPIKHPPHTSSSIHSDSVESRLSDDTVTVKQEPDEVYPVGLHSVKPESRKRPVTDSGNNDMDDVQLSDDPSYTGSKQSRLDDSVNPENESLMSIIGINESDDMLDVSQDQEESISREIDYLIAQNAAEKSKQSTEQLSDDPTHSPLPSTSSATKGANNNGSGGTRTALTSTGYPSHPLRRNRRADRLKHVDRRLRSRINTFESWLQAEPRLDCRAMEQIPPEELDKYLVEFFPTVKTISGDDFSYSSLCALRSSLEKHLRDQGYPLSIISSPEFRNSRWAWLAKLKQCKQNERNKLSFINIPDMLGPLLD